MMILCRFPLVFHSLLLAGVLSVTAGCSNSNDAYYRAETLEPIKVPDDKRTASLEPLYKIPDIRAREDELLLARGYSSYEVPRPEPLATEGATESGVKIQKLGDERWILADAPTSQVWPRTQSFLSRYGLGVDVSDAAAGLIETAWVRFKDDAKQKHRFRIWIERGLRPDTTEIHLVHRQVPEAFTDASAITWDRESDDAEREAFLMDELASSLAADVKNSSASLLGQRVGGAAKADIDFIDDEPVLRLRLQYPRAWATVSHSLAQDQFVLWESDSAKGVALVGHLPDVEEKSFIGRLFSRDSLPENAPIELQEVLNHLAPEPEVRELFADISGVDYGSPEELEYAYLVVVKRVDGESVVYVRSAAGEQLPLREARRMLTIIRRNLI